MKMHHKLKQCIISEKRCIRVDYLVTEERPSEFCFEVILYHPDGSEEREEIHNMVCLPTMRWNSCTCWRAVR